MRYIENGLRMQHSVRLVYVEDKLRECFGVYVFGEKDQCRLANVAREALNHTDFSRVAIMP